MKKIILIIIEYSCPRYQSWVKIPLYAELVRN